MMNFLTAEWRKLAIINYEVNPEILEKYLPNGVELDFWDGKCLISVVGFMFLNTQLLGISVPFHRNFEEVNLRFYVKKWENQHWKRGVVFIKEIVSKKALSIIANTFYKEHYETLPMKHLISENTEEIAVEYSWGKNLDNKIKLIAKNNLQKMLQNSDFEFITEHYFGYTKNGKKTFEYEVTHPKWKNYEVLSSFIQIDFKENYGTDFEFLQNQKPHSILLAEGSEIEVKTKTKLNFN